MDGQNNPQQQAPQQTAPAPVQHPHTHMFIMLLAGLFMFGVGLEAGYFLFANKAQPAPMQDTENISRVSPTTIPENPTPTTAVKTNVNSYTNNVLKITFQYPDGWYTNDAEQKATNVLLDTSPIVIPEGTDAIVGKISVGLNQCTNTITNQKFACEKTVTERIEKIKSLLVASTIVTSEVTVDGVKGMQISGTTKPDQPGGDRFMKEIILPHDDYLLIIGLNDKEEEAVFKQLLDTLQFIN
jgi:hypothetical protein